MSCESVGRFANRHLFDISLARVELEIIRVIDTPAATHVRR
ncbi:MAG TPA: hypothetical protein VFA49_05315 [Chloroflexota bacterium]|nr:hypothetical protein [Chloroflexota bacterium]